jgi:hypothetical protein
MGLYSVLNQEIMRISYLFLFLLLNISVIKGQDYPEFSDLSSREFSRPYFSSVEVSDGFLYLSRQNTADFKLFKVNYDGVVTDSALTSVDGYKISGYLYFINNRIFLIGSAYRPLINFDQLFYVRRNSILEFNQDLDLIGVHLYNNMPYGYFEAIGSILDYNFYQPLTSFHLEGDTMSMIHFYYKLDTITFVPSTQAVVLDKVGLNDSIYSQKYIAGNLGSYNGAVILNDKIFIHGWTSECCYPVLIDFTSVGEFTADGDFVRKISLAPPDVWLDPAVPSSGILMNDRVFTSYNDAQFYPPICEEEAAVIDIRDKDFNLLHLAKVPDCGFYPSGTKCFAEQGNKIYFLTRNALGDIGLYQYDTLLNLQWSKFFDFAEPHLGFALNSTPDGGCIMECFVGDILKLYKVDCFGNIVSSTQLPIRAKDNVTLFPNPFTESLTISGVTDPKALVQVYDLAGKLCQSVVWTNNTPFVVNTSLTKGMYVVVGSSLLDGRVLFSERVVKE